MERIQINDLMPLSHGVLLWSVRFGSMHKMFMIFVRNEQAVARRRKGDE